MFYQFPLNFSHSCNLCISETWWGRLLEGVFVLFSLHESLCEPNGDLRMNLEANINEKLYFTHLFYPLRTKVHPKRGLIKMGSTSRQQS